MTDKKRPYFTSGWIVTEDSPPLIMKRQGGKSNQGEWGKVRPGTVVWIRNKKFSSSAVFCTLPQYTVVLTRTSWDDHGTSYENCWVCLFVYCPGSNEALVHCQRAIKPSHICRGLPCLYSSSYFTSKVNCIVCCLLFVCCMLSQLPQVAMIML